MRVSLIFVIIVSFMLLFQRISDSRFTWIHDFEENWTESVGPVLFSAEYLICQKPFNLEGVDFNVDSRCNQS